MNTLLKPFVVALCLLLGSLPGYAQMIPAPSGLQSGGFMGMVNDINANSINISDRGFRLSPTVKVLRADKSEGRLSEIQPGTAVFVAFITINKRQLVDTITIFPSVGASGL